MFGNGGSRSSTSAITIDAGETDLDCQLIEQVQSRAALPLIVLPVSIVNQSSKYNYGAHARLASLDRQPIEQVQLPWRTGRVVSIVNQSSKCNYLEARGPPISAHDVSIVNQSSKCNYLAAVDDEVLGHFVSIVNQSSKCNYNGGAASADKALLSRSSTNRANATTASANSIVISRTYDDSFERPSRLQLIGIRETGAAAVYRSVARASRRARSWGTVRRRIV